MLVRKLGFGTGDECAICGVTSWVRIAASNVIDHFQQTLTVHDLSVDHSYNTAHAEDFAHCMKSVFFPE